ncbi:unnamed protein product [Lymnaea stagnalis]|uniref:Uncharacterized protein n=1 Tax=Lymnaea stagnalis TaxID=6523 RepID=A0AAV2HQD5_LYMST
MLPLLSFIRPKKKIHDGRYVDVDACQCRKRHTNKICAVPTKEEATVCRVEQTEQQGEQRGQGQAWESSPKATPRQPTIEEDRKAEGGMPKEDLPREDQGIRGCEVPTPQTQGPAPTVNNGAAQSGDANTSALGYEGPNPYAQYIPPGYQPPPPQNYGNQSPNVYGNQPPPGYGGQPTPGQLHGANSMQLGYSYNSPPQQVVGGYEPPPGYSIQEAVTSPYQNPQTHIIYVFQHPSPHQPQSQRQSHATELPIQEATTTVVSSCP